MWAAAAATPASVAAAPPADPAAAAPAPGRRWALEGAAGFALQNLRSQDIATRNSASLSTQSAPAVRLMAARPLAGQLGLRLNLAGRLATFMPPTASGFGLDRATQPLWSAEAGVAMRWLPRWSTWAGLTARRMLFVEARTTQLLRLLALVGVGAEVGTEVELFRREPWRAGLSGQVGLLAAPGDVGVGATWQMLGWVARRVAERLEVGAQGGYGQRSQDGPSTTLVDRAILFEVVLAWRPGAAPATPAAATPATPAPATPAPG